MAPGAPTLPSTEYTVQSLVLHESIPPELISDGPASVLPAPVLPDIPPRRWMRLKGRSAKVEQWRDLHIVGSNYFRLEYMCLQVFMLFKRPSFGGPGVDRVFDAAFLRAIGTVVGNYHFYSMEKFIRDKLGNIYNSIQDAYDEGAECIRDGLLRFYPELVIPSGIQQGTIQWNNALRTAVEDLVNRPGGYLHLVSVSCPLTHLTPLTPIRYHKMQNYCSISTRDSWHSWKHYFSTLRCHWVQTIQVLFQRLEAALSPWGQLGSASIILVLYH